MVPTRIKKSVFVKMYILSNCLLYLSDKQFEMKIGFDAKRIYQNKTGLGNYSRTLVASLAEFYPDHSYYLFAPKITNMFDATSFSNMNVISPQKFPSSFFTSAWRSSWVKNDVIKNGIDVYHGLSHEIPLRIQNTSVKSVVTIHDLIFERYPKQYSFMDVRIHRKKILNACRNANEVIAISEQTKLDLINLYKIEKEKIKVCYQSCNPAFENALSDDEKNKIKTKYQLPNHFFLSVGSIIERKNLLNICKAYLKLSPEHRLPLVVIGDGGEYKRKVVDFVKKNNLENLIIFLSENESAKSSRSFQNGEDFPAIYQLATALIYPSYFEGFGIPILEALWSRTPVITSNVSCLPETGGDAALYVNPDREDEIAEAMKKIVEDNNFANEMKLKGWNYAQKFTQQKCADAVMNIYTSL